MIKIGRPFVEIEGNVAKLCAEISVKNQKKIMWYAVPKSYEKYLVYEQGDAFIVPMLYTATALGMDICSEISISDNLFFQLNHHLLPIMSKQHGNSSVKIVADTSKTLLNCEGKVGTGYSAGVDSFYSIMKHTSPSIEEDNALYRPRLDTLCVIDTGVFRGKNPKKDFEYMISQADQLAEELSIEAMFIYSNIPKILQEMYMHVFIYRLVGAVLALQKYFGIYLLSSNIPFIRFDLSVSDLEPSNSDLLNVHCFSTEILKFNCCGGNVNRIEKLKALSKYKKCYSRLSPCARNWDKNCGTCKKCRHDIVALEALNELDTFKNVFDVDYARKNMEISIALQLANANNISTEQDVVNLLKKTGYKIPKRSYILAEQMKKGLSNYLEAIK